MILLLIIAVWTVVLSLVAGLCVAARVGDLERPTRGYARTPTEQAEPLAWEQAEHAEIWAHANAQPVEPDAALLGSGGIAA